MWDHLYIVSDIKSMPYTTPERLSESETAYYKIPIGHAGFRAAAAEAFLNGIEHDLQNFREQTGAINNNSPVFITGHSLGGALALVIRPRINNNFPVDSVYVYGAPIALANESNIEKIFLDTTFLHRFNGTKSAKGIFKNWEHDNVPRLTSKLLPKLYKAPGNSFEIFPDGELQPYPEYHELSIIGTLAWSGLWLSNQVTAHNLERSYLPALKFNAEKNIKISLPQQWWMEAR